MIELLSSQLSHLAPTYAAVNALVIVGRRRGLDLIDRPKLASWLASLRLPDGSFLMHEDGEVDIRGAYCALSVARIANVFSPSMFANTAEWVLRCQTYEGGFGGAPGMEAHGGYTFCGLAALALLGGSASKLCREDRLLRWAANRQMRLEGGFQGRTNKLVDGCYSFWQGGMFPILHALMAENGHESSLPDDRWLFDQESLQEYLLICCQDPRGGLVDKPGKARDFYHTCYTLSGLSVAQNFTWRERRPNARVLGPEEANAAAEVHPLHNVGVGAAAAALRHFQALPVPEI